MVLLLRDIHEAAIDPTVQPAPLERAVEITVDVVGQRDDEARIVTGRHKPRRRKVREGIVVEHDVDIDG